MQQQAIESIPLAKKSGFNNFSVDLIYGTPDLLMKNGR